MEYDEYERSYRLLGYVDCIPRLVFDGERAQPTRAKVKQNAGSQAGSLARCRYSSTIIQAILDENEFTTYRVPVG